MPPRTKRTSEPVVEPVIDPEFLDQPVPFTEEDTITFKRSHFYSALSVLTFIAGLLVGYFLWGTGFLEGNASNSQTTAQADSPVVGAPVEEPQYRRFDIPAEGFPSLGPRDAPITLVEFSDFQCPYCQRWYKETYQPLLAAYPGKIRVVYRHLPLTSIHPDAFSAAEASMCAGDQNVFWQYHDKLFNGESLGYAVYEQYAQELSLDLPTFVDCISEHKYQAAIQADSDFAINLGVSSTPTFFINGIPIIGAQPLDAFKRLIDKELAGEIP